MLIREALGPKGLSFVLFITCWLSACSSNTEKGDEKKVATLDASVSRTNIGLVTQSVNDIVARPSWTSGAAKLTLEAIPKDSAGSVKICTDRECKGTSNVHTVEPGAGTVFIRYIADDLVGSSVTFRSTADSEVEAAPITVEFASGELAFERSGPLESPRSVSKCHEITLRRVYSYTGGEQLGSFHIAATFRLSFTSSAAAVGDGFYSDASCTTKIDEIKTGLDGQVSNAKSGIRLYVMSAPGAKISLRAEAKGWKSKDSEFTWPAP